MKIKPLIKTVSFLSLNFMFLLFSQSSAGWYNPNWSSRNLVLIDNSNNSDSLYDFQVKVDVPYFPEMQPDFDDIRFTTDDGITIIPYWVEEYSDSNYAIAWVKVPEIKAMDTTIIYLYYGNPDAESESDGEAVFDFFDDFNDQDISDWTIISGSWTAENKFLEQLIVANYRKILSSYSIDFPSITEAKMIYLSSYNYSGNHIFYSCNSSANSGYYFGYDGLTSGGEGTCIAKIISGSASILVSDSTINNLNYAYSWLKAKITHDCLGNYSFLLVAPDSVQVFLSVRDTSYTSPFILGSWVGSHIGIDDLRVRKFTDPEPGTSIGEQQSSEMIVIEPDYVDSTGTGQTKTYSIYVENQGENEDIVEIVKQWIQPDWQVLLRDAITGDTLVDHNGNGIPDIDTLHSNETRYLFCDIIPTDSAYAATENTTVIKAYFAGDTTVSDTCYIITKIITDVSLTIEPDQSGNLLPGESIDYSLDITNNGNIKDVVDVTTIQTSPDWSCDLLDSMGAPLVDNNGNWVVDIDTLLPFGTTCCITARIFSPASASPGDIDTALILVRFTGYPSVTDTATLITTVISPGSTLVLIQPDQTGYVDAGSTRIYNLTVRNLGASDDVIDITDEGTSSGWSCTLLDSSGNPLTDTDGDGMVDVGTLSPGGSVIMKSGITSPPTAQGGETDSTVIWAISSIDTSVNDNAHLTTIVNSSVSVLIEPDCSDSLLPQDTAHYNLTVTNLGNNHDVIDITYYGGNSDWYFVIEDANGFPLQDSDSDGKPDVGSIPPDGSVNITAKVSPCDSAIYGETDVRIIQATSSNNTNIYDTATLTTHLTGTVTLFIVEPDYSNEVGFGMIKDYPLRIILDGTASDYIEVKPYGASQGWVYELLDSDLSPLVDIDGNGMYDIGWLNPADTADINIRVTTPPGMAGVDSLSLSVVINGETDIFGMADSAIVYSYIVPILDIHNYASPFTSRTTFRFSIPYDGDVYLDVYNRIGEKVRTLLNGKYYHRGIYTLPWNGRNDYNKPLAPAVYYYVFRVKKTAGDEDKIIKKTAIVK